MEQPLTLPPSDEELVTLTLQDKHYFGELVDRYQPKLTRYIARLGVRNPEDQHDVLQEVFLKTYKNLRGFDTRLKFSSWIYRIAHNEAVSWFRRRNVRPEGHLVNDGEEVMQLFSAGDVETPDVSFDRGVDIERVNHALAQLENKYRQVLILRYFEYKEYDEISDILQIPVGSVGTLLHRGKRRLATALAE